MEPLTREAAEALDAADPLAGFRERFAIADEQLIYLDGNSLGRLPLATRERLAALAGEWGERLVTGWQDWIDAPRRTATCWRACSAPARARWSCATPRRSTSTSWRGRARRARARGARHRPRQLPDRPLRPRGAGRASADARLETLEAPDVLPDTLIVRSHVGYRSGALADMRSGDGRGAGRGLDDDLGPLPLGRRRAGRPARRGRRAGGRLHLQVPQRRAGSARVPLRRRGAAGRGCARRSGAGSASATSSRWSAPTTRPRASSASSPARRRSSAVAAVEEGARLIAEAGIDATPRQVARADRAGDRAARRLAGATRVRARQARATPRAAARTSPCATRTPGRSPAR